MSVPGAEAPSGRGTRGMLAAAGTSALLSLLFVVAYGTCTWVTSHRSDVGTWYFEWERLIPFVPLMIVPYWSLDLFFLAGPFVCRTHEERRTLARRIAFAIVAAGGCFLLIPLRFAFDRPHTGGWTGAMFDLLYGFDKPYNLFPSLHIALRTILADLYARHSRGLARLAVHVWFSLVGFSTLLTYQHHVVDLAGGFMLAAICFYLFREEPFRSPVTPNRRVGAYYAVGAAAAAALAAALALAGPTIGGRSTIAILLWPALALGLVAAGYFGLGPGVYRKRAGRLPWSARVLLAPVLIGQRLSLWWYRRRGAGLHEVAPGVWIGPRIGDAEAREIRGKGIFAAERDAEPARELAVLDLTAEFSEPSALREATYLNVPILDLTAPTVEQIRECVAFIADHRSRGTVYVHCKVGYSRTAGVVGAWLLASGQATSVADALAILRRASPGIVIRPEIVGSLEKLLTPRIIAGQYHPQCGTYEHEDLDL